MRATDIDTRALERSLLIRLIASSVLSTTFLFMAYFLPAGLWEPRSSRAFVLTNTFAFGIYTVVGIGIGAVINSRLIGRTRAWLESGGDASSVEAGRVWRLPYIYATWSLIFWLGAMIWAPLLNADRLFAPGTLPRVRLELSLALGGFLAFWFCWVLIELKLRPVFAVASSAGGPEVTTASSLATRLSLIWCAAAGVPLIAVALLEIGLTPARSYAARLTVWSMCGMALTIGPIFTYLAGRNIVRDVSLVHGSMRRIAAGDLDVEIAVDNPTEIGNLQAGFNDMVAGLRERRTLEDLFGRHVGAEVARYALAQGSEFGGETRHASVLFVDIVGSSKLAQSIPATEVVSLLNEFFSTVVHVLAKHGGWVNKFEGDGALGIFGAPIDQPDHASRALRAARELRVQLDALEAANPRLRAAIGVSSGHVVAGNVGAEERYEYSVIGDAVNEASRVTDEAKLRPGLLLASAGAVATSGDEAGHWHLAGTKKLRGREDATDLYAPAHGEVPA